MGLGGLLACGGGGGPAAQPVAPQPADPLRVVWRYEVRGDQDELQIEAEFAPGSDDTLRGDEDGVRFVRDVRYLAGGAWAQAQGASGAWTVPCRASGCRVRYRFPLRAAAEAIHDVETALASGDVVVAPPSTWLLHPGDAVGRLRLHVALTPPARWGAGMRPSRDGRPDTYEMSAAEVDEASFAAIGPFLEQTLVRGGARVEVIDSPHALLLSQPEVVAWAQTAVDAIATYLGRFPVDRTAFLVQAGRAGSSTRGETIGGGGPAVLVRVGDGLNAAAMRDDWVATHELIHVVTPSLSREHVWLSEGVPTYVEPIVRLRAGLITRDKFWGDLLDGLPQGLPEPGDEGLERTHTWGRTYWGGALFCFVVDVTLREQTAGARSFDDVVRAIVATRADVEVRWDIERWLDVGDRATGTTVLHDLYRSLALAPGPVDLPGLWLRLGVRKSGDAVVFDDAAPLASVRRGIEGRK